ncbi:hypothetical protein M407DRAFT_245256 [Tulasnella calospora MUT 4182]|uniref:Uncharacterized protein n=1 Tax=Tulasnella calospora MUT 4182 TaxID=1051891 RepID=A0A0C3QC91_9AGAM|nr:hypothetical protein M407DRAFT_245256 [Tulasnella calospora MUT 4182]
MLQTASVARSNGPLGRLLLETGITHILAPLDEASSKAKTPCLAKREQKNSRRLPQPRPVREETSP